MVPGAGKGGKDLASNTSKAQGARRKAQGARRKAQGARRKAQGARRKAQGARRKAQRNVRFDDCDVKLFLDLSWLLLPMTCTLSLEPCTFYLAPLAAKSSEKYRLRNLRVSWDELLTLDRDGRPMNYE